MCYKMTNSGILFYGLHLFKHTGCDPYNTQRVLGQGESEYLEYESNSLPWFLVYYYYCNQELR